MPVSRALYLQTKNMSRHVAMQPRILLDWAVGRRPEMLYPVSHSLSNTQCRTATIPVLKDVVVTVRPFDGARTTI